MLTTNLQRDLVNYTVANSGYTVQRGVINLAWIGDCDQVIYSHITQGGRPSIGRHLRVRVGVELENALLERLRHTFGNALQPGLEISAHNGLVRGCPSAMLDGDVVVLKTVEREVWFPDIYHIPNKTYYETQAYMHFLSDLGACRAHIVFLARNTGRIKAIGVTYRPEAGRRLDAKIERLLLALQERQRPACVCGHCRPDNIPGGRND